MIRAGEYRAEYAQCINTYSILPFLYQQLHFLFPLLSGTHSPNTLALTSFPLRIGSTYGIGLFLEWEDWSRPITHRDIFPLGVDMVVHIFLVNISVIAALWNNLPYLETSRGVQAGIHPQSVSICTLRKPLPTNSLIKFPILCELLDLPFFVPCFRWHVVPKLIQPLFETIRAKISTSKGSISNIIWQFMFVCFLPFTVHIFQVQFIMLTLLLLPLLALASALLTTTVQEAASKPYQLCGVQSPIFHLYPQSLPSAKGILVIGPEASSEYFNIGPSSGKSYLPLILDKTSNTIAWN